jgi:hypothetical protein
MLSFRLLLRISNAKTKLLTVDMYNKAVVVAKSLMELPVSDD